MSVAPKLPHELLFLPESTRPCPACHRRPRRPVRFCTYCGTAMAGATRPYRSTGSNFVPSFSLPEPENGAALRNGFIAFSLALPLLGLLFLLNSSGPLNQPETGASESALSGPVGQEISTEPGTRAFRKTNSTSGASRRNSEAGETPEETAPDSNAGAIVNPPMIPDAPQPVRPYRDPSISTRTPIPVPVKSRPLPTPPLPGPDFRDEKRTEPTPRP